MEISGWLSTGDTDLSNEIVEPYSAKKHLEAYTKAGRLWFNHDPAQVLGRVHSMSIEEKGMHIDLARLSDTPFNREYIWPHIKEGALSEFSIQFQSRDGKYVNKVYHHTEIFIIESSIVSMACNPAAVIDGFKSLVPSEEWYDASLEQLLKLYESGKLKLPSEARRVFAVGGIDTPMENKLKNTNGESLVPDFADISVNELTAEQKSLLDPAGEALDLPKREQKNYEQICDCIYLAKSLARNSYMFRVGVPTEDGFRYDWEAVALATGNILGAKGSAHFVPEEKVKAIAAIAKIYKQLKKTLPTWKGIALNDVDDEIVTDIKFSEIEFHNDEKDLLEKHIFEKNLEAVSNYIKSVEGDKAESVRKYAYANFGMNFNIYPYDESDFALIDALMAAYSSYMTAEEEEPAESGDFYMNFANHLTDLSQKMAEPDDVEVSEEEEVETEVEEEVAKEEEVPEEQADQKNLSSILAEALKKFVEN